MPTATIAAAPVGGTVSTAPSSLGTSTSTTSTVITAGRAQVRSDQLRMKIPPTNVVEPASGCPDQMADTAGAVPPRTPETDQLPHQCREAELSPEFGLTAVNSD